MTTPIDSARPITKLKKYSYPHLMIFFDTESYIEILKNKERHTLRLGVAIFVWCDYQNEEIIILNREVYYYKTSTEFWNYVETKTKKNNILYIYAHNAKYDSLNVNIIDELKRLGYDLPFPTINNAFIISAKKGKKKIKVVDTFNYARTSVKSMGEKLGIEKISLEEYRIKNKDIDFNNIPEKILYPYCEQDVMIIEKFMIKLIEFLYVNKLGSLKFTTASIALDIYRHSFITEPIYYHKDLDILKVEREAYRGGIVECFYLKRLPKDDYYLLDINSMYVNVMAHSLLPTFPILYNKKPELSDLYNACENNYIIADVLMCAADNNGKYALAHNDKLIFPIGEFRITLHSPEIKQAIKENAILKCFSYIVYHMEKCLSAYALYFSELKKNSTNKTDYDFAKLLGNGLYGKFGMQKYLTDVFKFDLFWVDDSQQKYKDKSIEKISDKRKQELDGIENEQHYQVTNNGIYLKWGSDYIRTYTDKFTPVPRTNIALAGAVTAYSRILLSSYIEICGREHIYYSDTDSLVVDKIGYDRLKDYIDDKELGKLKCEFIFNSGTIRAPKNYTFAIKQQLHINGLDGISTKLKRRINSNILTLEHKSIIVYNKNKEKYERRDRSKGIPTGAVLNDGKYEYWRFTTYKEWIRSGGELKGRIKVSRKNTLEYTKGNDSGRGRTTPFIMNYQLNKDTGKWENMIMS